MHACLMFLGTYVASFDDLHVGLHDSTHYHLFDDSF